MSEDTTIDYFEELAERSGIQVRHEAINQDENSINVVGVASLF